MKRYLDMLELPRPVSGNRKHMSTADRAAQFSPFSALVGYEELIAETGRLTEERREPGEAEKEELDRKIRILQDVQNEGIPVSVVFFEEDGTKEGGHYRTHTGILKQISTEEQYLKMKDGKKIFFTDLLQIESDVFEEGDTE
ncbi:MAG: hypothetical protein IJG05_10300 [Solobacterium sp.]|nr:hypothetical protein [Solobacterium sp.]